MQREAKAQRARASPGFDLERESGTRTHVDVRQLMRVIIGQRSEVRGNEIERVLADAGLQRRNTPSGHTVMFGNSVAQVLIPVSTLQSSAKVKVTDFVGWVKPAVRANEAAVHDNASAQSGAQGTAAFGESPNYKPPIVKRDMRRPF